jgi:hypothetical protein
VKISQIIFLSFTYWGPGEPNNANNENCVELFTESSWWNGTLKLLIH